MDDLELGRIAYDAFGKATDYRSVLGDPMPVWGKLPPALQQAWADAARAVLTTSQSPLSVSQMAYESVIPFSE